ncbi:hypothetical protein Tco_1429574 [Tanacetum coccineum]
MRSDDGGVGLTGKVVISSSESDMMKNGTSTPASGVVAGKGEGRIGYARVLIELNAKKEIKDKIKIVMKPKERMEDKNRIESGVQDDTFQMVQNKKIRNGGINHANRWNGFNGTNGYQKNIVKQVKTAENRQNNGKVEFRRKNEIGQGKLNGKEHSKDGGNSEGSNRSNAYKSPKKYTINAIKDVN